MTRTVLLIVVCFSGLFSLLNPIYAQQGGASEMYGDISYFEQDVYALHRKYTLRYTDEYFERFTKLYAEWLQKISQVDFESLSLQGKADYVMLKNHIKAEDYFLQNEYEEFKKVKGALAPFGEIYKFVRARRYGEVPDYQMLSKSFSELTKSLPEYSAAMKKAPFGNWMVADKARQAVESLSKNLKETFDFYNGYDPLFTWWVAEPYAALSKALAEYAAALSENYSASSLKDDGSGIIGKPIGKKAIEQSLAFSFIPYSPEELIAAAEAQFRFCEAEMLKAAAELGFGKDWKAALEYVKNTYVPPSEQPHLIDSLASEAITFVEERDLLTVPDLAKETWRMIMMTPERQLVNPFFTGGEVISISYPTSTMTHDQKMMSMRGNNPNFSTATVHHELIPGHHLQQFMTSRYKPYRQIFSNAFWGEGWALYWEINLWNKQFPDTPEERIGMLFWRMHRCARIIFSLSYHLEKMTPQQCIDLLVNRVGHEYANAEAEVRRSFTGGYDPLYQIAYMIGGLQFYALQKEMLAKGWTEKQYHDAVLKEGSIPIEVLRVILMEGSFEDNFSTRWRFSTDFK